MVQFILMRHPDAIQAVLVSFPSLALSRSGSRVFLTRRDAVCICLGPLAWYFYNGCNKLQLESMQ